MSDDRAVVRGVVWQEILPWLILVRCLRLALGMRVLLLSAVAVVCLSAGWQGIGLLFIGSDDALLQHWVDETASWPWQTTGPGLTDPHGGDITSAWHEVVPTVEMDVERIPLVGNWLSRGPVVRVWKKMATPFIELFGRQVSVTGLAYLLLCCLWALVVWGLFGGATTRIAALFLARAETLGMVKSIGHAVRSWVSYIAAPLLPLLATLFSVFFLVIVGLLMRSNLFLLIAGLFWGFMLVVGLFLVLLLIGLLLGWPLLWSTISVEGTDAFDALSRSYAYVYQRPFHYLFYLLIVSLLGMFGLFVVDVFAEGTIAVTGWATSWGVGSERMESLSTFAWGTDSPNGAVLDGFGSVGGWLVAFWIGCVRTIQRGFLFGFFWVTVTGIYFLLRRDVDATEMDEVALEEQEETHSLPPLGPEDGQDESCHEAPGKNKG